jgi:type IV pilus assembly protein PilC
MATPVLGEMLVHAAMEKFANNLALLLRSGVPLLQALETLREVMNTNILYRRGIELVQRRVSSGGTLAGAIEETGLFPSMVAGMVRVGEGSGKLPLVLDQVATYYAQKVEVGLMRAMTVIEPAIIVGMGGTVGVIMAAIYLPMFQLSSAAR